MHLLRRRQPGGMVEGYIAAVGGHAIDKFERFGVKGQVPIALVEGTGSSCWQSRNQLIDNILFL